MFGYVRPYKQELLVREFYTYKSVYCALCKQLGKDYGILSRLLLNYDCTFFALTGLALSEDRPQMVSGRCCCNPIKRCEYCGIGTEPVRKASALSIITSYYKVKDNMQDSGFFSSMLAHLIYPILSLWRKRASKAYPDIEAIINKMFQAQAEAEKDEYCIVDKAAEPTAEMFSQVMLLLSRNEREKLAFSRFGYFFGKWVYLIDAIDDYEKDVKSGDFNPFKARYDVKNKSEDEKKQYFNEILNQCIAEARLALKLIDMERFGSIIDNVFDYGLPMTQKKVIFDKKVDINV